jgi:hypothetical protein
MRKHNLVFDIAAGGTLAFVLLVIVTIDRLVNSATSEQADDVQTAEGYSTLLGDQRIAVQIKAIGNVERLEKLKVVRLNATARFANAKNVNDITLMWCWEPKIAIRFDEENPEKVRLLTPILERRGEDMHRELLLESKACLDFSSDATLERRFEEEFRMLLRNKDYGPVLNSPLLIEGKQAHLIFNNRLPVPMKPARTIAMRNLCFALSISNLIPVRRHKFEIETGEPQTIRDRKCKQVTIKDQDGLKLQLYFDEETNLLAKISHMGHDPQPGAGENRQVLWEHYFSDYRETDGIKQWRRLDAQNDGQPFVTLEVTGVKFFDEMRPELRRPKR